MVLKKATQEVNIHEWSFLTIYVSVEMFLNLDFMQNIDNEDKVILKINLQNEWNWNISDCASTRVLTENLGVK